MSLKTVFPDEIPEETRLLVDPLLTEDSVYRLVGQEAKQIVDEVCLAEMYAQEGRGAVNPVILALVLVFQFLEKLPDRQAAQMAVMRMDWKYALRQPLDWGGFHYSDLSNFRKRLLAHGQERAVFEGVVRYLRERGHLKRGGKQRTDSTHILGAVERLSRLELVWETLRVTLGALISADAVWTLRWLPASFVEQYSVRRQEYRLSKEEVAQEMQAAGQDGYWLLAQLEVHGADALRQLPEVAQLRRVLDEQFEHDEGQTNPRPPGERKGDVISTPHDPEARYRNKGSKRWIGYQLQVTETANEDQAAQFITDVEVNPAIVSDQTRLATIQQRLIAQAIPPAQHYVDQGYMSGHNLAASQQRGVDLRGLIRPDNSQKPPGFRLADFAVDVARQQATCPAGQQSTRWSTGQSDPKGNFVYHVSFGPPCQQCPFFGPTQCTTSPQGRHLRVNRYHDLIQARRREMQCPDFQREMHIRAAIEGTVSELVRAHGARRARYRGLGKNALQAVFIATATNLKRLARCLATRLSTTVRFLFDRSRLCVCQSA